MEKAATLGGVVVKKKKTVKGIQDNKKKINIETCWGEYVVGNTGFIKKKKRFDLSKKWLKRTLYQQYSQQPPPPP